MRALWLLPAFFVACSGSPTMSNDAGLPLTDAGTGFDAGPMIEEDAGVDEDAGVPDAGEPDAGAPDAGIPDAGNKADQCASVFGGQFTDAFGRADGIVTAVVMPGYECPLKNSDHVVIQISIDGGIQRLVVNVQSDRGDPRIKMRPFTGPLPSPAWSEGWHPGLTNSFPQGLGVHSNDVEWQLFDLPTAAARVYDSVEVGQPISIYATSQGYPDSAHKIHFNGHNDDGAIVLDPLSTDPHWLLFSFQNQIF